ncbi:MAG TPA: hypothetical protein VN426_05500 [Syntrophomonadaceae bacterium]|nr:hypothetical protein [Syntrophomonadaceae bacterium]
MSDFVYEKYEIMVRSAIDSGYHFSRFAEIPNDAARICLLRHDIDICLQPALALAAKEAALGVASTYFVMLTSESYNCLSPNSRLILKDILDMGHEIGLHFSKWTYQSTSPEIMTQENTLIGSIHHEIGILEDLITHPVRAVSFHKPTMEYEGKLALPGLINSYRKEDLGFDFYLSDSRMHFTGRKPEEVFKLKRYKKIQLLIHPMWWRPEGGTLEQRWLQVLNDGLENVWQPLVSTEDTVLGWQKEPQVNW